MPIGFAGRGTAGRLSGGGTAPGARRVALGVGVASLAFEGSTGPADCVGGAAAEGVADADEASADGDEPGGMVGAVAVAVAGADEPAAGPGVVVGPDAAGRTDDGGEPDSVVVQPAMTPAHTRALRAITVLLTSSG